MRNYLLVLLQISCQSTSTEFQPFSVWLTDANLWWYKGFTSEGWSRLRRYVIKLYFSRGRRSAGLLGIQFTACRWGRLRYGFTPPRRARPLSLTAGFIWCGRPVLGFSVGFNIWSPLWAEEEGMPVDDCWLGADMWGRGGARGDGGRLTDGEWRGGRWKCRGKGTSGFSGQEIKWENLFCYTRFTQTKEVGRISESNRRWQVGFSRSPSVPYRKRKWCWWTCSVCYPSITTRLWSLIWFRGCFLQHSRYFVQICRLKVCIFPHEHHIPSVHSELIEAGGSKNWCFLHVLDVFDVNRRKKEYCIKNIRT